MVTAVVGTCRQYFFWQFLLYNDIMGIPPEQTGRKTWLAPVAARDSERCLGVSAAARRNLRQEPLSAGIAMQELLLRESSAPEPTGPLLRLTPDHARPALVLLVSLPLLWFGFKVIESGNPEGWFLVVLFSLSALSSLLILLPGSSFVQIDAETLTIASCFRKRVYRWDQIERMGIFQIGLIRRVGLDLNSRYSGPERVPNFNKPASGYHVALPAMAGMQLEDLLDLMQQCHALRGKPPLPRGRG